MRKSLAFFTAGLILAAPITGYVQQVPGQVPQPAPPADELRNLVSTHTEAIKFLQKKVTDLETRIRKLEDERAAGSSR